MSEPERGDLDPTTPIKELPNGRIAVPLWYQDGTMVELSAPDNMHNRSFVVWLRKFDRWLENASVTK